MGADEMGRRFVLINIRVVGRGGRKVLRIINEQ